MKIFKIFLVFLVCFISISSAFAARQYGCTGLTGGAAGMLDSLDITGATSPNSENLANGDTAFALVLSGAAGYWYRYVFDADGTDAESSPNIIRPDDYSTAGVWRLVSVASGMLPAASGSAAGAISAADYTKLSGIESNATADQTGAEIKVAYEAQSDTNAFTDAEKTKLAGIADGAQVDTDTTLSQEEVEDYAGAMVTGGTETGIDVTYDDATGKFSFVVTGGSATVEDAAYDATWNGDTDGTSKNTIYDYLVNFDADSDGDFTDEAWFPSTSGAPTSATYLTTSDEAGLSAETVVSANGVSFLTAADYSAMRALLDLEIGIDVQAQSAHLDNLASNMAANGGKITGSYLATGSVGSDQLSSTTVTPGSYTSADITIDGDGRVTAASSGSGGGATAWDDIADPDAAGTINLSTFIQLMQLGANGAYRIGDTTDYFEFGYDGSTFFFQMVDGGTVGNIEMRFPADGITDSMPDWGTGPGQINTDDIPEGSTNLWATESAVEGFVFDTDNTGSMLTTGTIEGGVNTIVVSTNTTLTAAQCYGSVVYVTATSTVTLPAIAAGMNVVIIEDGAAVTATVDINASDLIRRDGNAQTAGVTIVGPGGGGIAVITYRAANTWYATTNDWTEGT